MNLRELLNAAKGVKINFAIARSRVSDGLKYMQIYIKNGKELVGTVEANLSLVQDKDFDQKVGDFFIEHIERKREIKGFRILELFINWIAHKGISGVKRILCQTHPSYVPYYTKLGFKPQKQIDGEIYYIKDL